MRLFLLFFLAATLQPATAHAQAFTARGTVISAEDGLPMIGATVREKATANGTVTDVDGRFTINVVSPQAVLEISFVGFETQDFPLEGRGDVTITLQPATEIMEEVIVTGYKREVRSELSSSISSIKARDIDKLVVNGIDQALQGQAPGVTVTQVTGSPGDDIAVRIRGAGTLGNNNPLYVIDGIPATTGINMFSTSDIESIEILKDAAAAAIYGARAANGVILITTRRGKPGPPQFNFEAFYGIQQPVNLPELLNAEEYLLLRNEAITNANVFRNPLNQLPTYDPAMLDTLPDIDWLDQVFDPAGMSRYSLSAGGGSETGSYYIAAEVQNQDGIFKGQSFDKYQLRINGDLGNEWFRVGTNLSFAHTRRQIINGSGDGFGPGNELSGIRYALIASPVFPIYNEDGSYVNVSSLLGDPVLYGDGNANPLAFIDHTDWTLRRYRVFGNAFAEVALWQDRIHLRTTVGGDIRFDQEKLFKERLSAAVYDPTSLNEGRVNETTLVWNNTLDFRHAIGDHHVSALLGMEAIDNHTDYLGASANNFRRTDPLFRYINGSIPVDIRNLGASGTATEWALLSFFAQAGYSFKNRYVLSAAIRRDGSSRFGKNNRWGTFPSVSAAWNISNERFFGDDGIVSALKLRASWGRLGNQEIGIYPYSSLVSTGDYVYVLGDGTIVTGASIVESGNANVKWETSTQTNVGVDAGLWQDRLTIMADYFVKRTDDILVRVPVPQAGSAGNPPYVNAASVRNSGLELGLQYRSQTGELRYNVGANIATVKNEVISIADSEPILGGFGLSDGPLTRTEPGHPIGSFYLWEVAGIFQSQEEIDASAFQTQYTRPGDIRFADLNGDMVIDDKDRRHVGDPFPDFTFGANLGLTWKDFDFSVLLQGVVGNHVYFLYGNFAYETQLRGFNSYRDLLDRWTPTNTGSDIPQVSVDDRNGNRRASTRFLYDGSYARIRNITLGYNFKDLVGSGALSSIRVYFTVQNAFTFTKYPGLDPEIQANTNDTRGLGLPSDLSVGIDWGTVPAPRTWVAGIQLGF